MTAGRDQHGLTRQQIAEELDRLGDDEPESYCTLCGWTGHSGGTCHCDDGVPRA